MSTEASQAVGDSGDGLGAKSLRARGHGIERTASVTAVVKPLHAPDNRELDSKRCRTAPISSRIDSPRRTLMLSLHDIRRRKSLPVATAARNSAR